MRAGPDRRRPAALTWIKVDKAHVRSGPGTNHKSYGTLESGTKVYVVGRKGDWAKVSWVHISQMALGRQNLLSLASPMPVVGSGVLNRTLERK